MSRVFVGLSGGVDSAVSAALLQEQGHDVTGAFIKIWQPEFLECTWREDRLDAMRVAAMLGIPFLEVDFSDVYKKEVVNAMVAAYERGETPNPDVLCNKSVKFGVFWEWAKERGAEMLATGHYARTSAVLDSYALLRGNDKGKDQSYFLHRLSAGDLSHTLFPVGPLEKLQVRALAEKFDLPVARRPDSQGLCFVGDISMSEFLRRFMTVYEGPLVDTQGKEIGRHGGASLYTIGQRHGFLVTRAEKKKMPYYVVGIDIARNTVVVSPERDDAVQMSVRVDDINWIRTPKSRDTLLAQTRYRETPVKVSLAEEGGKTIVTFAEPHLVSPGQSIVFYSGDVCLGGGVMRFEKPAFVYNSPRAAAQTVQ